ncbi:ClpP/crotonase [Pleurostoma richardsiae]|uniref:ClpP/crotonase n=1 Tax=Pleurostoma richardsiae TaxID=41990 RepID=A0AA38VRW7_9PEZI|nr:ClpP/crotonase [Pleurostoma richardsiae]
MATTKSLPDAYFSLPFKEISLSHVPASSDLATKVIMMALNRPEKYNAVTENMLIEMEAAYELLSKDDRVRAIVLTGAGKAFCAGADLQVGFAGLLKSKQTEASMTSFRDRGGRVALAIARCAKPTIVAINGPAAGFGFTITLPAAIRVAWTEAKVGMPFARRGLTMESCSAFYLPRLIGMSKAIHIATTGATYSASDPLVSQLFSKLLSTPKETVEYAVELAADIAENTSLASTKLMRDMMVYCPPTPEGAHILDSRVFISMVGLHDNWEGVKSFTEKRKPQFRGEIDQAEFPFWPWWDQATEKLAKI